MRRFYLPFLLSLSLLFFGTQSVKSQDRPSEIYFCFNSLSELKSALEVDAIKTLDFKIEGLRSDESARAMESRFLSYGERVIDFNIENAKEGAVRKAEMTLAADVRVSHFSKILITYGVNEVKIKNQIIQTADLNNQEE